MRHSKWLIAVLWFVHGLFVVGLTVAPAPAQMITEFALPSSNSGPVGITPGLQDDLWFTEFNTGRIGRITTEGSIVEFAIPTDTAQPSGIALGPDGNFLF